MDILGASMFQKVGGWEGEVYKAMFSEYMLLFWGFALALMVLAALIYFILRKDKSESVAVLLSGIVLVLTGWEDILFYVFQGRWLDPVLPWLNANAIMNSIALQMGFETVTSTSLLFTAGIGLFIVVIGAIIFKEKF